MVEPLTQWRLTATKSAGKVVMAWMPSNLATARITNMDFLTAKKLASIGESPGEEKM